MRCTILSNMSRNPASGLLKNTLATSVYVCNFWRLLSQVPRLKVFLKSISQQVRFYTIKYLFLLFLLVLFRVFSLFYASFLFLFHLLLFTLFFFFFFCSPYCKTLGSLPVCGDRGAKVPTLKFRNRKVLTGGDCASLFLILYLGA